MTHKTHLDTRVIHAGQSPDPSTGAITPPIYQTSTYVQSRPGEHKGYEYSRSQNPTRAAFERCMADLEDGQRAFAAASGMAGIATILALLSPGDHIIAMHDLYGGTHRLLHNVHQRAAGLKVSLVDMTDLSQLRAAIRPETKMIWVESPSNPMLHIVDLAAIAAIGRQHDIITVADNTFATPILQQPLRLGFDLVTHSTTKYLNGHADIVGGVIVVGDHPSLGDELAYLHNAIGAIAGPFDSFLALRGLKTLSLRMERHCDNAEQLADWLAAQPLVKHIAYPGLASHPQHALATQQMTRYGGMIAVTFDLSADAIADCLSRCQVFALAESLGGVESLIEHPGSMTHAAVPRAHRLALGITDGLIRLSVGIEHIDDLKADLTQAFAL